MWGVSEATHNLLPPSLFVTMARVEENPRSEGVFAEIRKKPSSMRTLVAEIPRLLDIIDDVGRPEMVAVFDADVEGEFWFLDLRDRDFKFHAPPWAEGMPWAVVIGRNCSFTGCAAALLSVFEHRFVATVSKPDHLPWGPPKRHTRKRVLAMLSEGQSKAVLRQAELQSRIAAAQIEGKRLVAAQT